LKKISIITVCYNSQSTIIDTIESVINQNYLNIEYIVVDGKSEDETFNIVKSYGSRISKFISEPDNGIYDAMNKGISLASGDVIGFLNADDFYSSTDILTQVISHFKDPCIDACYGDLCYIDSVDINRVIRYWKSGPFELGSFQRGWVPPHPTFFVRKSVYEIHGVFNLSYKFAADFELMFRFVEKHHIHTKYINSVLVKMRLGGATNNNYKNILIQNHEIFRALKKHGEFINPLFFIFRKSIIRFKQFMNRNLLAF
jgi:glycosyltransferase involved in cell wall biosynthesis